MGELCVLSGMTAITVFWDLAKFYDSLDLVVVVSLAQRAGFPVRVAAMDLQVHTGLRFLRWHGAAAQPIASCTSVLAGSRFSNTYARVFL